MTKIAPPVRVIADSISPGGHRLTTMRVMLDRAGLSRLYLHGYACTVSPAPDAGDPRSRSIPRLAIITGSEVKALSGELGAAIRVERRASDPVEVGVDGLHLPFVTPEEKTRLDPSAQACVSIARCARVTGGRNVRDDFALYQQLLTAMPPKLEAFEHVAIATDQGSPERPGWTPIRALLYHRVSP